MSVQLGTAETHLTDVEPPLLIPGVLVKGETGAEKRRFPRGGAA